MQTFLAKSFSIISSATEISYCLYLYPFSDFSDNRPQGCKTFSMLNLVGHEILNAHKYVNIK